MRYVVAYDIPNSKRRERLRKGLKTFGRATQRSVFECDLTPRELGRLKKMILSIIRRDLDNVRMYPVCEKCILSAELFGGRPIEKAEQFYLV